MSITIKDVAAYAGVSFKTVSNVVNGHKFVREETRQKVLDAIEELGYRPHQTAKSLASKRSNRLGFLVLQPPEIAFQDPFVAQIIIGMHEIINKHGYALLVKAYPPTALSDPSIMHTIFSLGEVDAIIMVTIPEKLPEKFFQITSSIPLISLDEGDFGSHIPTVTIDNRLDGYIATKHLLKLGRKHIGIILPTPLDQRPSLRRLEGYLDAFAEYGISTEEHLIVETQYTLQDAYDQTKRLLKADKHIDALFVADDKRALAVYEAIHELGLKIPEDIAIIGHGGWMVGRYMSPSLTSIHHPFFDMGRIAADKAMKIIQRDEVASKNIILPTHLVIRQSCGAPQEMRSAEGLRD